MSSWLDVRIQLVSRVLKLEVLFKFPVIPSANLSLYEDRKNIYIYKKNSIILL